MAVLDIILDGEGMVRDVAREKLVHVTAPLKVGALAGGMASGAPSIAIAVPLPDGRTVVAETSLALFLSAADAFRARYGDPRLTRA